MNSIYTSRCLSILAACTLTLGCTSTTSSSNSTTATPAVAPETKPASQSATTPPLTHDELNTLEKRVSYGLGFMQGQGIKTHPEDQIDSDEFLRGFKAGMSGKDTSYAEGIMVASQIKRAGAEIDSPLFISGFSSGMNGPSALLTTEEIQQAMREYQTILRDRAEAKAKVELEAKAKVHKDAGAAFMVENAKKEGWKTTASGMQYHIINPGTGPHPAPTDTVTALYEGALIDGTVFDSSAKHDNQPLVAPLNHLIPAWGEAMALIGSGGKMEIVLPSDLGYGDEGRTPTIPPGATLRFTFELLRFEATPPAPAGADGNPDAELQALLRQLQTQQAENKGTPATPQPETPATDQPKTEPAKP